ncbi:MAG: hypothetical protein ACRBI6_17405 [Acidimicrobiales bacterium]
MTVTFAPQTSTAQTSTPLLATLRAETIKLTTVRATRVIAGLTIGVGGFAAFAVARFVEDEPLYVANVFGFSTVFTAVFAAVAAILVHTSDAEHGTLAQAFVAQPRRARVLAAKLVVAVGFAALLCVGGLAAGTAGSLLGGLGWENADTIPGIIGWSLGFSALAAVLGLGLGFAARQGAAAISGLLVWWLVVENIVMAFAKPTVARYLPFVAGNGMLGFDADDAGADFFGPEKSAVIFGVYALVVLAVGIVVARRTEP